MDKTDVMMQAIDICVYDFDAYIELCRKHCKARLYDVPNEDVNALWNDICFLTPERAKSIVNKISHFNFVNTSKQIKAKYFVYSGYASLEINGREFNHAEMVSALTYLRTLGLKITKEDDL